MTQSELFRYMGEKLTFPKLQYRDLKKGLINGKITSITPKGCSVILDRDRLPIFFWFTENKGEKRKHIRNLKIK